MTSKGTVPSASTEVRIREGGFILKTLEGDDENSQAYRLRHTVFSEELGMGRSIGNSTIGKRRV